MLVIAALNTARQTPAAREIEGPVSMGLNAP
jgi:hypothetical protein